MKKSIYREISLKKLSSPEQLDQLIRLTSPKAWLALAGIGLLLVVAVIWSFMGSIPTKLTGTGILLNNAGVYTLKSNTTGQVTDVRFTNGDMVKKGDVLARVEQPELVEEINDLLDTLSILEENKETTSKEYQLLQSQVEQLREKLVYSSRIVAPITGRIIEFNIHDGSVINQGDSLAMLEQYDSTVRLEAVIYISAEQAGRIKSGMEAQIVPSMINKEEYGFIEGRVISVDKYPATEQSMLQTLGNENLVKILNKEAASVKVNIDLTPDKQTISGYKWSSQSGPPLSIPSGTLVQGAVVISREKPIYKVIPSSEREVETNE